MVNLRKKDFKLGTIHGKLIPEHREEQEENNIRNRLFYRGNLKLNITLSRVMSIPHFLGLRVISIPHCGTTIKIPV